MLCCVRTGAVTFSRAAAPAPAAPQGWNARAAAMKAQLKSLGLAGLLAYGILNTVYYTAAFYTVWMYVAKVPRGVPQSPCVRERWVLGV